MPPLAPAHPIRERIRRNVGYPPTLRTHSPPLRVPGRYGHLFRGGELLPGSAPTLPNLPTPTPPTPPTIAPGRTYALAASVITPSRAVLVTPPLPIPSVIRALTLTGNASIADAISYRILIATDPDTTPTANPSGTDLITFGGDVIASEDPGLHAHLTGGPLNVEPWHRLLTSPAFVKLKIHNTSAGTRVLTLYIDLDELTTTA